MATMLHEELAEQIQGELNLMGRRLARISELAYNLEFMLDNGDTDLGAYQAEIELSVELVRELASLARIDLTEAERACSRALGEDDMEMAA